MNSVYMNSYRRHKSIRVLGLSNRAFNALMRAHLRTIGDLCDYIARDDLRKFRNIGEKTVAEINEKLEAFLAKDGD